MYTSMFEVYKNINIIPFAQKLLCQSHLKDGDTDALNLSMPEVIYHDRKTPKKSTPDRTIGK